MIAKVFVIINGDLRLIRKGLGQWTNIKGSLRFILKSEIRITSDFLKFFGIIKRKLRPIGRGLINGPI